MTRRLFTTRHGGVSSGRWASGNLATHVGDDPDAVLANRGALAAAIGVPASGFGWMDQVHGTTVAIAGADRTAESQIFPATDGLVTDRPGVALAVLVADCVPVLVSDDRAGVIGAAHAGRLGAAAGIARHLLDAMTGLGARPDHLRVTLGPAICGRCYEVPASMRDAVAAALPGSSVVTDAGTPGLELRSGLRRQFESLGVPDVRVDPRCTFTDLGLYSHRRATLSAAGAPTGRFAGIIWMSNSGVSHRDRHS